MIVIATALLTVHTAAVRADFVHPEGVYGVVILAAGTGFSAELHQEVEVKH